MRPVVHMTVEVCTTRPRPGSVPSCQLTISCGDAETAPRSSASAARLPWKVRMSPWLVTWPRNWTPATLCTVDTLDPESPLSENCKQERFCQLEVKSGKCLVF